MDLTVEKVHRGSFLSSFISNVSVVSQTGLSIHSTLNSVSRSWLKFIFTRL